MRWVPSKLQEKALEFALQTPCCGLVLKPGAGKTSIALFAASILLESDIKRVLVCAPLRVCQATWPDEADKWDEFAHISVYDITEMDQLERDRILYDKRVQIVLINPESMEKVVKHPRFHQFGFDMLILDESQKWKDSQTARFKKLKPVIYSFKRRLLLTGTMIPNGYEDLFGQMYVIDEGERLGKFITRYRMDYFYRETDKWIYTVKPTAVLQIKEKVKDVLFHQPLGATVKEPELIKRTISVVMPEQYMEKYRELDRHYLTEIQEVKVFTPQIAAKAMKLRQFANGFFYYDVQVPGQKPNRLSKRFHDEKIKAVLQLVDELQGEPLLLGYEFDEDQAVILEAIPDAVDLGRSKNIKMAVQMFNQKRIRVAIGQVGSISLGLNLQESCANVCLYNPLFNLEHYIQFIARVGRQGNPNDQVTVWTIATKGTRDAHVARAMEAKEVTQRDFDQALMRDL